MPLTKKETQARTPDRRRDSRRSAPPKWGPRCARRQSTARTGASARNARLCSPGVVSGRGLCFSCCSQEDHRTFPSVVPIQDYAPPASHPNPAPAPSLSPGLPLLQHALFRRAHDHSAKTRDAPVRPARRAAPPAAPTWKPTRKSFGRSAVRFVPPKRLSLKKRPRFHGHGHWHACCATGCRRE
jgi:hypothetical protein